MSVGQTFEDVLEIGERVDIIELGGGQQRSDDRPARGAAVRGGLMMPGIWDAKSGSPIRSTRYSGRRRSWSPTRFMMAAGI
jgi:hypothetical protein